MTIDVYFPFGTPTNTMLLWGLTRNLLVVFMSDIASESTMVRFKPKPKDGRWS